MRNRRDLLLSLAIIFILNILIITLAQGGFGGNAASRGMASAAAFLTIRSM